MYFKTSEVAGLRIFYHEAGDPAKPSIVLLHGFLLVAPVPRPPSASGGSVSCHRARLSRHGVQQSFRPDRPATDLR